MSTQVPQKPPRRTLADTAIPTPAPTRSLVTPSNWPIPLRLFLGVSFVAAGLDKLTDPGFFDSNSLDFIGNQLGGFAKGSPVGGFLTSVAVPNATLFGWMVLLGELAIGLGTLVGLFSRLAAFFGFILSMTLWLTASWGVSPFYLGSDLPYAIAWLTLALVPAHPVFSLDGVIARWRANRPALVVAGAAPADSGVHSEPRLPVQPSPTQIARRQFLTVGGATILAGAVTGIAWAHSLADKNEGSADTGSVSTATQPTTAATGQATQPSTATQVAPTTQPAANTTQAATNQAAPTSQAAPAPTQPAQTTQATAKPSGPVIASLANLAVGNAVNFKTPDTGESAILIRLSDGSVRAFNTTCTHEGCEVGYVKSQQILACPCHGAQFDIKTGAATRRPARLPLAAYKVQIEGDSVVYQG